MCGKEMALYQIPNYIRGQGGLSKPKDKGGRKDRKAQSYVVVIIRQGNFISLIKLNTWYFIDNKERKAEKK